MDAQRPLIDIANNRHFTGKVSVLCSESEAQLAWNFHKQIDGYQATPTYQLSNLAKMMGLGALWVKDESQRFDLSAFKMLGGAYAIARALCRDKGLEIASEDFASLRQSIDAPMTFATATDGNHGRGVAWSAKRLGQKAVVYMPKGSAEERVRAIRDLGSECIVTDLNYDDTVRLLIADAVREGWTIVQDTAWDGYEEIPTWIMQGYMTLAVEAYEQLQAAGSKLPTHVLLQAGVGGMAAAVLGYCSHRQSPTALHSVVIEADRADCLYRSIIDPQGEMVNVEGALDTIMAGLACGEPNPIAWPILRDCATQFVSCKDEVAALGMRVLGNPLGDDPRIVAGESGAVGVGLLVAMHQHPDRATLFAQMGLSADSVVLCINTEGDTDPQNYRDVVWRGALANKL